MLQKCTKSYLPYSHSAPHMNASHRQIGTNTHSSKMATLQFQSLAQRTLLQAPPACTVIAPLKYGYWAQTNSAGGYDVCTTPSNVAFLQSLGSDFQNNVSNILQWIALALCIASLMFYAFNAWKGVLGWEEVYVVCVELVKVILEVKHEFDSPATLYLASGNMVQWIRYGEWLLSCPVILIHLSNLTGAHEYSSRTMMLLISDLGCIICGVTSAMAWDPTTKWVFFAAGMVYGSSTYFHAAKVFVETYQIAPQGQCRNLVKAMAAIFFAAWSMFPILFVLGPEGTGTITRHGSNIAHTIADIMSKQVWSFLGHYLRNKIHDHVVSGGHLNVHKNKIVQEPHTEKMMDGEGKLEAIQVKNNNSNNNNNNNNAAEVKPNTDGWRLQSVDQNATATPVENWKQLPSASSDEVVKI